MEGASVVNITDVAFKAASGHNVRSGLLGWLRFVVNGSLQVDGCTLRRTLEGDLRISFPRRTDGKGQHHTLIRPVDDRARRDIEHQVFTALGFEEAER